MPADVAKLLTFPPTSNNSGKLIATAYSERTFEKRYNSLSLASVGTLALKDCHVAPLLATTGRRMSLRVKRSNLIANKYVSAIMPRST